jgi:integrase
MASYETRTTTAGQARYRGKYRDHDGNKHAGPWGPSKKKALDWARDEEAKLRSGTWHDSAKGRITLADYFAEWLPLRNYEKNTAKQYRSLFNAGIREELGPLELRRVTKPVIQRWVSHRIQAGDKPLTIRARFILLQTILACRKGVSALGDELIASNPCETVSLPHVPEGDVHIYEIDESEALCMVIGPWWAPLVILAGETGLRWGELMGLTVGSFNEDYSEAYVRRTIVELSKAETGNGTPWEWKDWPKNRRPRKVAIGEDGQAIVKDLIRSRRLFADGDRLFSPPSGKNDGLPLRTEEWPEGRPVYKGSFRKTWRAAHVEAGVIQGERVFHSLRGSHLSWLLDAGADLATVQGRADHRSITTTERYLTALKGADTRALDALATAKQKARERRGA